MAAQLGTLFALFLTQMSQQGSNLMMCYWGRIILTSLLCDIMNEHVLLGWACRPDMNMQRLHRSSRRLLLADYDPGASPQCLEHSLPHNAAQT